MIAKALLSLFVVIVATQQPPAREPDWEWLHEARPAALEALMPMATSSVVACRSYRDLYQGVHERYFRISRQVGPAERHTAVVVMPQGFSIQQQLLALRAKSPQASVESLLASVSLRRLTIADDTCPVIRGRLDALSGAAFVNSSREVIHLHPTPHRIRIRLLSADIDATLHDEESPIVRWAEETWRALLARGAAEPASVSRQG